MNEVESRERDEIVQGLSSPDDEMRRLALERVVSLPAAEAIPRLVESLGDPSWRVRKTAVERLVACNEGEQVVRALIDSLADGDNPGRRNAAVEALIAAGSRAVAPLLDSLEDPDVDVRKLVVDTLAGIARPETSDALVGVLADPDPNVRGAAADALGVIGGESAVAALTEAVQRDEEDRLVRLSALRALGRLEIGLSVTVLGSVMEDSLLQPAACTLLGNASDDASREALLKALASDSRMVREAAMEALLCVVSRLGPDEAGGFAERIRSASLAAEGLLQSTIERLPQADLSSRLVLVQFLGLVGDGSSVLPILEAAGDEALEEVAFGTLAAMGEVTEDAIAAGWEELDPDARRDACGLLARTAGARGSEVLMKALDGADAELRATAARALGRRGCGSALPTLIRRMEAASREDELEADEELAALVEALVDLGRDDGASSAARVIEQLAARLEGSTDPVRLSIARVVGRLGRPEDAELVTRMLKDPSAEVRGAAVEALARIETGAASEPLRLALADESPLVRVAAATALGGARSFEVLDDLRRLVHDEDARVRAAAVRAAGAQAAVAAGENASEAVIEVVEPVLGDEPPVAIAGVETLQALGGDAAARAAGALLERSEPELVQAAVACIGAHGSAATLLELLPLIPHPSWAVRAEVVQALADRRVVQAIPQILRRLETEQDGFVRDAILRALKKLEE